VRLEPHQGRFAARIGVSQNRQSFLETGARGIDAEYLARVAAEGVDVHFVLTGERIETDGLGPTATKLLAIFLALPGDMQDLLITFGQSMLDKFTSLTASDAS
jgi:transcriptional regulator with XRE-family HTH domain